MGERTGPLNPRNKRTAGSGDPNADLLVGDPSLSAAVQGQPTPRNQPYPGDARLSDAVQGQPVDMADTTGTTGASERDISPEGRRINEEMGEFVAQEDAEELGAPTSSDRYADNDDDYDDDEDESGGDTRS